MELDKSKTKNTYRYNIKLPIELRENFEKPYQMFIGHLLSHSCIVGCDGSRPLINHAIANAPRAQPKYGFWTLWMNKSLRDQFLETKSILMPNVSHCEFLFVLLTFHKETLKDGGCDKFNSSRNYQTEIINIDKLPPLRVSKPYALQKNGPKTDNTLALTTYLQIETSSERDETSFPMAKNLSKIMDLGNLLN
jgi:hypothetical protein